MKLKRVKRSDSDLVLTMARLFRAARKQLDLNQSTVAKLIGVTQGSVSKVERAQVPLLAPQWIRFCEHARIPLDCAITGYIDRLSIASLDSSLDSTGFKIPSALRRERGSKVRAIQPFLIYARKQLGERKLNEYLKSNGLDPDFFLCMDHQLNLNFILDLSNYLISKGKLKEADLPSLVLPIASASTHGLAQTKYQNEPAAQSLLSHLIHNSSFYECNFSYQIRDLNRKKLEISVTPEDHIDSFRKHPVYQDRFLCQYRAEYFRRFSTYGGSSPSEVKEMECAVKGDSQCTFQVVLAG